MRSNFNQLLVALAVLDIAYVATGIWDYSCVKVFNMQNTAYAYIFPHFWYPMKNILNPHVLDHIPDHGSGYRKIPGCLQVRVLPICTS